MKACCKRRKDLQAFLFGEPGENEKKTLASHIQECPACRKEAELLGAVINDGAAVRRETEQVMETVDWNELPSRLAVEIMGRTAGRKAAVAPRRRIPALTLRPALAGLLFGLFFGALGMLAVLKFGGRERPARAEFYASREFLEDVELQLAKRETLSYLEKSGHLLLDFVEASPSELSGNWQVDFTSQRARELLSKKKYINRQLETIPMAKARIICDQIELLIIELSQLGEELAPEQLGEIRSRIEDSRLLFKINLLKKELQESV